MRFRNRAVKFAFFICFILKIIADFPSRTFGLPLNWNIVQQSCEGAGMRCKTEIDTHRQTGTELKVSTLQRRCSVQPTLYNLGVMLKQKALGATRH